MKPLTVIVTAAGFLLYIGQSLGDQPWSVLPNITGDLCPGTCIWPRKNISDPYCCKGCSCEEDCFLENNCCFGDNYKEKQQHLKLLQRCTIAATRNLEIHPAFEMIDRNPPNGCVVTVDGMKKNTQCGKIDVAEWGSIYPVISKHTGKIYRNELCALCHNDTSYATWTPIQVCEKKGRGAHFVANVLDFASISKYQSDKCYFVFRIDGFDNVLYDIQCFLSYINRCPKPPTFTIPDELNLTRTEIVNACMSGFMSPVENYANIFCWMCANQRGETPYCSLHQNDRLFKGFSILLDPAKLAAIIEGSKIVQPERQACLKSKDKLKETCAPLLCPTGQILIEDKCDFAAKQWRQATYRVQMKLKLIEEQSNDNSSMANILDFFYKNNMSTIESSTFFPWEKGWRIARILYQTLFQNGSSSGYIVFALQWENNIFNPNTILKELKGALSKGNGELYVGAERFTFSHELDTIPLYQRTYPNQLDRNLSSTIVKETNLEMARLMPLYITKLFFCEQVELNSDEFSLAQTQDLLYYKAPQVYLYWSEFSVFDLNGKTTARICVSDSLYSADPTSGAITFSGDTWLILISVTLGVIPIINGL